LNEKDGQDMSESITDIVETFAGKISESVLLNITLFHHIDFNDNPVRRGLNIEFRKSYHKASGLQSWA